MKLLMATFIFFLAVLPVRAGAPGPNEAESLPNGELLTDGNGESYFVYSPNGGVVDGLLFLAATGDTLTIGTSGGTTELGVPTRFNATGMFVDAGATGRVASPAGAAGGTIFFTEYLDFADAAGFVVESGVDSTAAGRNRLIIQDLQTNNLTPYGPYTRLTVEERATAEIRNPNYINKILTFELAGGEMSFADSLTIHGGEIEATAGNSFLAVGNGLTLDKPAAPNYALPPAVRVTDGAGLTLLRELGGTEAADLTLGAGAILDIQNGGVLNAGTVRFTQDHDLASTVAQAGTINVRRLEFTSLTDAAELAWHVADAAAFTGTYTVKGIGNTYGGLEMAAGAVLTSDAAADTAIALGTEDTPGGIRLDGGSIRAGAGRNFTIKGARVVIASAPAAGVVLDGRAGKLDLSESALLVDAPAGGGVMAFDATAGIIVGDYEHRSGEVAVSGTPGGFAVTGAAAVGGGEVAAKFVAAADAADFRRGMTLLENGALAAAAGGGTVRLGGDLTMAGGAALDGGGAGLTLAAGATGDGAAPAVRVAGLGNLVRGAVATGLELRVNSPGMALGLDGALLEAGAVTVERGGIYAVNAPSTIRAGGSESIFTVAKDGALSTTSAGLSIEGYDAVVIDGVYTAGWDGNGAAALTVGSDLTLGSTAAIHFTDELLANITPGPDAAIIVLSDPNDSIKTQSDLSVHSIFGSVDMVATGGTLAVTSISNRIKADSSPEDIALAAGNMRSVWGAGQIPAEFAALAYAAAVTGRADNGFPSPGDAAGRNKALLRGIANPSGVPVGLDTVEFMNGSAATKVNAAGLMAVAAVNEQASDRIRELRGALSASRESFASDEPVASDVAFASAADADAGTVGEVYFAGLRVWDRQDDGDGFSGYEYDAHGFNLGYDRALSSNIALGASFAYYQGDYADAGALAHASSLDGYALTAYGVYNRDDGLFLSGTAGYARFTNDIRELRSDPSSPAGASWTGARYDSGVLTLAIDAGFDYNPADYLTLTPSLGLLYMRSAADDHDASLGGVVTQRERGIASDALLFPFRLAGRYEARLGEEGRVILTASLGYTFNAIRNAHSGGMDYSGLSASVPVAGRTLPRHSVTAGFGVRFLYRCFDFGLDYSFAGGAGRSAHRLAGTVGAVF